MPITTWLLLLAAAAHACAGSSSTAGYVVYCPCMGRFGNQAEQLLGSLAFAIGTRRTLVVPPWISYGAGGSVQLVEYQRHFSLSSLAAGHAVVSMRRFMSQLAPTVWPPGRRVVFCHSPRQDATCQAKVGSPFRPFWDQCRVHFDADEFYGSRVASFDDTDAWRREFPSDRWPVIAFMGAPAAFPARPQHLHLHRAVQFSQQFLAQLRHIVGSSIAGRYVGIHLRNNVDFTRACRDLVGSLGTESLFSSYQCYGPAGQRGRVTLAACDPDDETIVSQAAALLLEANASVLFVASDFDDRAALLRRRIPRATVVSTKTLGTDVFQDVGLLALADRALLNCVSSLSAFVRRARDSMGSVTHYLAFADKGWRHTEL